MLSSEAVGEGGQGSGVLRVDEVRKRGWLSQPASRPPAFPSHGGGELD